MAIQIEGSQGLHDIGNQVVLLLRRRSQLIGMKVHIIEEMAQQFCIGLFEVPESLFEMFQLEGLVFDFLEEGRKGEVRLDGIVHIHRSQQVIMGIGIVVIRLVSCLPLCFRSNFRFFHFPSISQSLCCCFQRLIGQMLVENESQGIIHIIGGAHSLAHDIGRIP